MASKAAIEMTWESMSQVLVDVFPELHTPYEELLAWWTDPQYADDDDDGTDDVPGNHIVYGDIFTLYLICLLDDSREEHYLRSFHRLALAQTEREERTKEGFDFLEGMCLNEDIRVQEVAVVTILEYMHGRSKLLALATPYFGPASLSALKDLDDFWGTQPERKTAIQELAIISDRAVRAVRLLAGSVAKRLKEIIQRSDLGPQ